MIVLGGMIGLGKTTTARMLGKALNLPVYYESVDDNIILPYYYKESYENQLKYRYPFLLQLAFLKSRYHQIRLALKEKDAVMDRSIYEDKYFVKKNIEMGRLSLEERDIYLGLLDELMEEEPGQRSKAPEVMVYLTGSFDLAIEHIRKRGRAMELGEENLKYMKFMYDGYDDWFYSEYKESPAIVVNMDKRKVNENKEDQEWLINEVKKYLYTK